MNPAPELNTPNAEAMPTLPADAPVAECWNKIGINADNSCPELVTVIHCRNCPVYAAAGRGLLDRVAPDQYRDEWGALLARPKESVKSATQSVVIFSLGVEYLALPTSSFREVADMRVVHRLPGSRRKLLMGLVNIRGEIQICVSLGVLLKLAEEKESAGGPFRDGRMLVVEHAGEAWVFPVNKVHGTYRYDPAHLRPPPSTLEKAVSSFSRGTITWEGKPVGCLSAEAVFTALKGNIA